MLNAFNNLPVISWVIDQFYEHCDLVQAQQMPDNLAEIPGRSPYAYVITAQSIYLINRQNNSQQQTQLSDQNALALRQRLRLEPLENDQPLCLVEESASIEKIRALTTASQLMLPKTIMPIINALVISLFLGLGSYAYILISPFLLGYIFHQRRAIRQRLGHYFRNFRGNLADLPHRFGEWAADFVLTNAVGIFRIFSSLSILLLLGLNTWSIVAIYGIYRFPDLEWVRFFKNTLNNIQSFGFGFFNRTVGRRSFYVKLSMGCAMAIYVALEAYTGGALAVVATGLLFVQSIAIVIGFKALFRDLYYTLKNPIKVLLKHTGKIWGALWGRYLAYMFFTGRVEGTLGPAVGHVIHNGIFSGLFSSFLMPVGWFTTHKGMLFIARLQNFFNNVLTSIFITTEMQTQGTFYGTVGPTLLQLFSFMLIGCAVGYLFERALNYFNPIIRQETPRVVASTLRQVESFNNNIRNRSHFSLWHIAYVAMMTPLMMQTQIGTMMLGIAAGNLAGATFLTALAATFAYGSVRLGVYCIRRLRRGAVAAQAIPAVAPSVVNIQLVAAIPQSIPAEVMPSVVEEVVPILPAFRPQAVQPTRRTRAQTRQQQAPIPQPDEHRPQI